MVVRLLLSRAFGPFFFGKLLSSCGAWIKNVSAAVVVFDLTGSALIVGMVSLVQFAPRFLLLPLVGPLADRLDRRKLVIGGRGTEAVAVGALAGWIAVAGIDGLPGVWPILGASLTSGVAASFVAPAIQAMVPSLVADADLDQAIALNSAIGNIARMVGPAAAAGLLLLGGPGAAFGAASLGYAAFAVALTVVTWLPPARVRTGGSLLEGLRYVRRTPGLGAWLLAGTALGFAIDPVITLTPALAASLDRSNEAAGLFASSFGVGAVVGVLLVTPARRRLGLDRLCDVGLLLLVVAFALLAGSTTAAMAMSALALGGCGLLLANTALMTGVQRSILDQYRGRVMALWGVAFQGVRPVAAAVNGAIADYVSVRVAFLVTALVAVAAVSLIHLRGRTALARQPDDGKGVEGHDIT